MAKRYIVVTSQRLQCKAHGLQIGGVYPVETYYYPHDQREVIVRNEEGYLVALFFDEYRDAEPPSGGDT